MKHEERKNAFCTLQKADLENDETQLGIVCIYRAGASVCDFI